MKTHGAEHDVVDGMNAQGDSFYGSQGTYYTRGDASGSSKYMVLISIVLL